MDSKKIIVVDIPNRDIWDFETVKNDRHEWAYCECYKALAARGISVVGAKEYLSSPARYPGAVLWRRLPVGGASKEIIAKGARPGVLMGYENPMYAVPFFWDLSRISSVYPHSFLPGGAKKFVSPRTIFHASFPPQPYDSSYTVTADFKSRKFLTMISGNAGNNPLKRIATKFLQFIKPLPGFDSHELYIDRLLAIEHFSHLLEFDLYGRGWGKPIPYFSGQKKRSIAAAVKRSYRGEVEDKFEKLKEYKFSICFENYMFDGWITEKIIDSLFAGCVPVYWGANDVVDFIPRGAFIDFRDFKDFAALEDFLTNMDEKTYNSYIEKINYFVHSPYYERFSQKEFINNMANIFENLLREIH